MAACADFVTAVRGSLNAFGACNRGNIILTFALVSIPVIGSVGAAMDYSRASSASC